jgi:hypothetical protein
MRLVQYSRVEMRAGMAMNFFDDLALGSPYHQAKYADTFLKIEPTSRTPSGHAAFQMIVNASRDAAKLHNYGFSEITDVDTGHCQAATIHFRDAK